MLTLDEFVNFTNSDLKRTNKSEFPLNIFKYKQFVNQINESLESDKYSLNKMKKGVLTIYNSGIGHVQNEFRLCELLERLGQNNDGDFDVDLDNVGTGLCKFSVIMRDLSCKYKQLMQNLSSLVVYPLDMFLKGDIKNDAKKPFEKAIKDYEVKADKLKKDRLSALNKENASTIYKPNGDNPFDFSEDLERERRIVQIQLCEFLLKVNEIKSRKGAELVQQLIDYYRAQTLYFKEGLQTMEHMGMFINDLVKHIDEIKNKHFDENQMLTNTKKELMAIIEKNTKQASPGIKVGYNLHQPQGNKAYGTSKEGWLLKKSDGMVKRVWQKRKVKLSSQFMMLYHGDDNKAPVVLPMLTCHIKHPVVGDADSLCFDLISNNRTYNFRTEDDKSLEEWLSVLSNAKAVVFEQAMSLDPKDDSFTKWRSHSLGSNSFTTMNMTNHFTYIPHNKMIPSNTTSDKDNDTSPSLRRNVVMKAIRKLKGNNKCADCGGIDPEWVSVNFGVLICLECCGVHRELGVHHSRTQSLRMDTFYSSQLLLPRFVGNKLFNDVYEATLSNGIKPPPSNSVNRNDANNIMHQRKSFIRSKYIDRKFVNGINGEDKSSIKYVLFKAIQNANLKDLIQAYAEGADLMTQFTPEYDPIWDSHLYTSIHLALMLAENSEDQPKNKNLAMYDVNCDDSNLKNNTTLLTILEFILQNSPSTHLKRVNNKGDTILHQAIKSNQLDAAKIILRSGVVCAELMSCKNYDNQTVTELAESLNKKDFIDLLDQISPGYDKDYMNYILDDLTIDWELHQDFVLRKENKNLKISGDAPIKIRQHYETYKRILSENTTSYKSGALYVDFNHSTFCCKQPLSFLDDHKCDRAKNILYTADEKFGIKTSSNTWNEITLPRKKSLKGPAPEPIFKNSSKSDNRHLSQLNQNNSTKCKPGVSPKPIIYDTNNTKQVTPQPKTRNKIAYTPNSNVTLPRNKPSSTLILQDPEEDTQSHTNSNLKGSLNLSHSSDNIDVLLDVLEEPKKLSNTKEVIHFSQSQVLENKNDTNISNKLIVGIRASARFNCKAENRDELSFVKGDIIIVKNCSTEDGWWEGFLEDNPSQSGMFPSNFVHKIS